MEEQKFQERLVVSHLFDLFPWKIVILSSSKKQVRVQVLIEAMLNNPSWTTRLTYGGHHGSVGTSTTIAYDTFGQQFYVNMAF